MIFKQLFDLQYSNQPEGESSKIPYLLQECLKQIEEYFSDDKYNKICFIFPSKEFSAQWLTIPYTLELINTDWRLYKENIFNSYKNYKEGEKVIINKRIIAEWAGNNENGFTVKTTDKNGCYTKFFREYSDVVKLKRAKNQNRKLSSYRAIQTELEKQKNNLL